MESKTTSKTSQLKALLLRAWRERWSDVQWGKNIKTVLPRGVSGDVYNLADCILQQALVGSAANQLALSYLRHSLSSQVVSHAAVLQRLSKFMQFNKIHCILSLLEFLEDILPGVTCCGKSDESKLASALLATTNWLLQVLVHAADTPNLGPTIVGIVPVEQQCIDVAIAILKKLLLTRFNLAMLYLARYNEAELYTEVCRRCCDLENLYQNREEDVLEYANTLLKIDYSALQISQPQDVGPGCIVQGWIAVQLVGRPDSQTEDLADRLRLLGRLKAYSEARLYSEIIRGSLMILRDVGHSTHESLWGAFAFLKIPSVLAALSQDYQVYQFHQLQKEVSPTSAVFSAVEMLLQHPSVLDGLDACSSVSSLECLLGELSKCGLLSDAQVRHLCEVRGAQAPIPKLDNSMTSSGIAGIPKVIMCAETTLTGILKTLSSDFHKIQDAFLGMLHQVLTGKSFELILAVATVQGQLKALVQRLIRFNECSKVLGAGIDKSKAQSFDISFIMLVAIVQNYGTDVVLDSNQDGETLVEDWVRICMVEAKKPKAPEGPLKMCDPAYVDQLINQFNSGDSDFKPPVKWQDMLYNMPGVMKEVLLAWEQGSLLAADVKRILDAVRGRMCCLSLAAAAWLCNYMRTAPHDTILKPLNMVQQLLTPPLIAEDENLRERWQLTCEIIQKMQRDVQLVLRTKTANRLLISRQPAAGQLRTVWQFSVTRGWLGHEAAGIVHTLVETAGPRWLVAAVLQELLQLRNRMQLERAVDLALAIFHVDIAQCTLNLLTDSLPQLLLSNGGNSFANGNWNQTPGGFNNNNLAPGVSSDILGCAPNIDGSLGCSVPVQQLMEPQLSALSRLTGYCIYAASATYEKTAPSEDIDCEPPASKIRRQNDHPMSSMSNIESERNPIVSALRQLLTSLETAMQDGHITQQMYFAMNLLRCLVDGRPPQYKSSSVLTSLPSGLISLLLRTLPDSFSPSMILQLHDVTTIAGRVGAARDLCVLRNHVLKHAPPPQPSPSVSANVSTGIPSMNTSVSA